MGIELATFFFPGEKLSRIYIKYKLIYKSIKQLSNISGQWFESLPIQRKILLLSGSNPILAIDAEKSDGQQIIDPDPFLPALQLHQWELALGIKLQNNTAVTGRWWWQHSNKTEICQPSAPAVNTITESQISKYSAGPELSKRQLSGNRIKALQYQKSLPTSFRKCLDVSWNCPLHCLCERWRASQSPPLGLS